MSRHDCIHGPRFCTGARGWKAALYLAGMIVAIYYGWAGASAYFAIGFAWNMDSFMAHKYEPQGNPVRRGSR